MLLHFKGNESEISDPSFFVSPRGRYSPKEELIATLKAFYHDKKKGDDATLCRYPARVRFLKKRLALENLPEVECQEYDKVLARLDPQSATLVFPSAHINSPASMFGHTFLRINSSYNSRLLSYAVNYAADADPDKENAIIFALKGLFGGYVGKYSLLPYYDKLKEYRDTENRDIWEYDLLFDEEETLRMLEHIWEIKDTRSSYYFFTDNCSYEMLWLMEIARPDIDLRGKFFYEVIPLETVHAVKEEELVRGVHYRPSKRSVIEAYESVFGVLEKEAVKALVEKKLLAQELLEEKRFTQEQKRHILEASIELLQYRYQKGKITHKDYLDRFHTLASARAKLGKGKRIMPKQPPDPTNGHRAKRITFGGGMIDAKGAIYLGYRPAYHSLDDPLYGFLRGTKIEFLNLEGFITNDRISLEHAYLLAIDSIALYEDFFHNFSWRMHLGWDRDFYDDSNRFNLLVGAGYGFGNDFGYLYALLTPQIYVFDHTVTALVTSFGGVFDRYSKYADTRFEYSYKRYDTGVKQNIFNITQTFRIKQNFALRFRYDYKERHKVAKEDTYRYTLYCDYFF